MKNKLENLYSRRQALKHLAGGAGALALGPWDKLFSSPKERKFKIGACDWSIGKRGDIEAFPLAKKIGLDGIQVSLASGGERMHLLERERQKNYLRAARKHGVEIGGMALGILNQIPYKSDPRAEKWVSQSIDVAESLDCSVVLLAFFGKGNIKKDQEGRQEVIRRLRKVAPKAEEKGVILGIESWLSVREHMEIIEAVNSDNVKVYYDVANSNKMGYDIYEEIRWLGKSNICEFHAKENGFLLGQGRVDFQKVRNAIDDIGYKGWIQIEGAVPEGEKIVESYRSNTQFIQSLFNDQK